LRQTLTNTSRLALAGVALILGFAPADAQAQQQAPQSRPWLDPALLAAAKAEGTLTVYSSTNEQEGLPLFKIFEEATGIKVQYVRGSDSVLTSRMTIEFRANQKSYDIVHMTTINKLPPQLLEAYEPVEAKNIIAEARDPGKRWYGVYANFNSPAYNTRKVKASDLPATYEEFAKHKEWAGQVAIDGTDNEWLKAMFDHYGEQKATQLIKDIVATLKPVVTDGHLAMARATGAGEYAISLNNYVNLSNNVKLAGSPIEIFALDPVALFAPWPELKLRIDDVLARAGPRPGHIFNLGHGILPETPVDNVKHLARFVQQYSVGDSRAASRVKQEPGTRSR